MLSIIIIKRWTALSSDVTVPKQFANCSTTVVFLQQPWSKVHSCSQVNLDNQLMLCLCFC